MGVGAALIAVLRAIFRRFGTGETARAYILSGGAAAMMGLVAFWVISANSLDALERDCRDHILAAPQMAGVSHFAAEKHVDSWTYGASGGGFVAPWSVGPHSEPKVAMLADFYRGDSRLHHAWIECLYTKKPDSGDPPQLAFDQLRFSFENVLDGDHWQPWLPPRATAP